MPGALTVLGFPESAHAARRLAAALGCPYSECELHRFPDGESRVRLPAHLSSVLVIYRSLDQPNDKLVELLFVAETARALGARRLILVAPYLCYMRQDTAFRSGEAVSQRLIGRWLAGCCDALATVDPHLHRVASLAEVFPSLPCRVVSAAAAAGRLARTELEAALIAGPDAESRQWIEQAAAAGGLPSLLGTKRRTGDASVEVTFPVSDLSGHDVLLVDDIASTGTTLARAAVALREAGAGKICAFATHALCDDPGLEQLKRAGVSSLWSADTVPHPSNRISMIEPLADACRELLAELGET
jgi:ribose-phosphate pyrophosphokinase